MHNAVRSEQRFGGRGFEYWKLQVWVAPALPVSFADVLKEIEMTSRAAAVAAITLMLMAPPAGAEAPAQSGAPPQIDPHPSLAEEAPHIVPVLQPPAAQTAPKSEPGLPEDAPNIVPVVPDGPGATYTRAPVE
jgi:hypothetical protein